MAVGMMVSPEPEPVVPSTTSRSVASLMLLIPVVCHTRMTSFSEPVEPSQLNLPASKRTPRPSST